MLACVEGIVHLVVAREYALPNHMPSAHTYGGLGWRYLAFLGSEQFNVTASLVSHCYEKSTGLYFVSGHSFYARVGSIAHKGAIQRRRMASVVGRNPTTKSQEADAERIRQYRPEVDIERTSTSPSPCILGRRAADLVESAVRMFSEVKRAGSSFYYKCNWRVALWDPLPEKKPKFRYFRSLTAGNVVDSSVGCIANAGKWGSPVSLAYCPYCRIH